MSAREPGATPLACPPLMIPGEWVRCAERHDADIAWLIAIIKNMYVDIFINIAQLGGPRGGSSNPIIAARRRVAAARGAIFSIASFRRALLALLKYPETHDAAQKAHDRFRHAFPNILTLRNTIAREFERTTHAGSRGASARALADPGADTPPHDRMIGERYVTTSHLGLVESIDLSAATLNTIHAIAQGLIDSLTWDGNAHLHPG